MFSKKEQRDGKLLTPKQLKEKELSSFKNEESKAVKHLKKILSGELESEGVTIYLSEKKDERIGRFLLKHINFLKDYCRDSFWDIEIKIVSDYRNSSYYNLTMTPLDDGGEK